jgi:hypothetical protein
MSGGLSARFSARIRERTRRHVQQLLRDRDAQKNFSPSADTPDSSLDERVTPRAPAPALTVVQPMEGSSNAVTKSTHGQTDKIRS